MCCRGGGGGPLPLYSDMGIPIPKTQVIWAYPSQITLAIWVKVRVTGDAHITMVLGMGMPISL